MHLIYATSPLGRECLCSWAFWPKTGCIHEPNMFILPKEVPQTGISQRCCSRSWRKGPKVTERPPLNVLQLALILLLRSQVRATAWHKPCTQASRSVHVLAWTALLSDPGAHSNEIRDHRSQRRYSALLW